MGEEFLGRLGTILWLCRPWFSRRAGTWNEWGACISIPSLDRCVSFRESDLRPTGRFDREADHLGTRFELSFDIVMSEEMDIVEGSYRLPGRFWEVLVFISEDVPELRHDFVSWESGITGVKFDVPRHLSLNRDLVHRSMSAVFGAPSWHEVHGPDTMILA